MKIGILECGHTMPEIEKRHGDFPEMFVRLLDGHGFRFVNYDVVDMQFPASVDACDGWLLTGSKFGAYDDVPFIEPLKSFIREAYDKAIPMVGVCFGHQIIAQALGGKVEKFDGGWALGLNEYRFDKLGTLSLNAWHQDQVIERPKDAKPIAGNDFCTNAALVYGTRAWTVQPHPEFGGEIVSMYADIRRGTADFPDSGLDLAKARASLPDDNGLIASQIAAFFKQPREAMHA